MMYGGSINQWLILTVFVLLIPLAESQPDESINQSTSQSIDRSNWYVVPVDSINESINQSFSCVPDIWPKQSSCLGHGTCMLLFDITATDPISQSINQSINQWNNQSLNQSDDQSINQTNNQSMTPMSINDVYLDLTGIHSINQLPMSICLCDSDYQARSDVIQFKAYEYRNCAMSSQSINQLIIWSIILFIFELLIAIYKLTQWWIWHRSIINQSINQSVNQSTDHVKAINQSVDPAKNVKSINQSFDLAKHTKSINQSINQSISPRETPRRAQSNARIAPLPPLINHAIDRSVNQSTNRSISQSKIQLEPTSPTGAGLTVEVFGDNQSINQSVNQPVNRVLSNQSINQSINRVLSNQSINLVSPSNISRGLSTRSTANTPKSRLPINQSVNQSNLKSPKQSNHQPINQSINQSKFLWKHMSMVQFQQPICCLISSSSGLIGMSIRFGSNYVYGRDMALSIYVYLLYQFAFLGMCIAQYHSLKLTMSMLGNKFQISVKHSFVGVMRIVKRILMTGWLINALAGCCIFLIAVPSVDETALMVLSTVGNAPFICMGLVSIYSTNHICRALDQGVSTLNTVQKADREKVKQSINRYSRHIVFTIFINIWVTLAFVCVSYLRLYQQVFVFLTCFLFTFVCSARMITFRMPVTVMDMKKTTVKEKVQQVEKTPVIIKQSAQPVIRLTKKYMSLTPTLPSLTQAGENDQVSSEVNQSINIIPTLTKVSSEINQSINIIPTLTKASLEIETKIASQSKVDVEIAETKSKSKSEVELANMTDEKLPDTSTVKGVQ